MGELATADPMRAFDGELHTFWADVAGERAWLGLDFSSQVAGGLGRRGGCLNIVLFGTLKPLWECDSMEFHGNF
jgi:hypothetical protein